MAEQRDNCVKELIYYLDTTYPSDVFVQNWKENYSNQFLQKKPVLKRTRSVVYKELKERLLQSYSEDYKPNDTQLSSLDSVENCINNVKQLEHWIVGNKRNIIYFSALQGQNINTLKGYKRGDVGVFLVKNGIHFSVSHCNALVRLFKLVEEYPKLQNCSIELGTIIKNMKTVKEICKELNWK